MAFDGLKETLKDQWADLSSKIQESSAFNNLREKFEEQTPTAQRAILAGAAAFAVLILLYFPYSYISASQTNLEQFESNRALIQGLLRASRAAKEPSPLPAPQPAELLKSKVENLLRSNQLVPEQIGEIANLPERPAKDLAPPAVQQIGLAVQVKKLNLTQIVAINHGLQNLGPGIKLVGLDMIQSAGQTHYYDMVARVVAFALPQMTFEAETGPEKGAKGKPAAPKKTRDAEETGE